MSSAIHFLNTGNSDCIILESDGHYAMIDAAEDTEFPADKPNLNLQGYEKEVLKYLKDNCKNEYGVVVLDFVVATHCHSDHIGGFDTVINDPCVIVKKAYLKPYHEENIFFYERKYWDNREVYEQMKNALEAKNVKIVENFENNRERLGEFNVRFLNGEYKKPIFKFGENVNSVVTLVEKDGKKAVLAGDMNYKNGGEHKIAKEVGKVDLLKVGHHGYFGSTSFKFAKTLSPEYSIVCNWERKMYPDVKFKLKNIAKSKILCTADLNGIKAIFDKDEIRIKTGIM